MATDNTQIAQIKGSFTNFLANNPVFESSFLQQYSENDTWHTGINVPAFIGIVGDYYFQFPNGNIYQYQSTGSGNAWVYVCNYFDSPQSGIVKFNIDYSVLAEGQDLPNTAWVLVASLAPFQFVRNIVIVINTVFVDSANNNDLKFFLVDALGEYVLTDEIPLENVFANGVICVPINNNPFVSWNNDFEYRLQFFATDLSLLTSGNLTVNLEIGTLLP